MPADQPARSIDETAAAWLVERDDGLTPARAREFEAWLRADARHAEAFASLADTWDFVGETRVTLEEASAPTVNPRAIRFRPVWLAPALGLAAAAVVALFWWQAGSVAAEGKARDFTLSATTEIGRQRRVELPDGSHALLNTNTAIEVQFTSTMRWVRLRHGEAHFSVQKDPGRAFTVSAADVHVRVTGTAFNVRLRPHAVDVLVTSGTVQVRPPPSAGTAGDPAAPGPSPEIPPLRAGQAVSVPLVGAATPAMPATASPAEVRQTLSWQAQRLEFDAVALERIVAEMNRYHRHQLAIADDRLREQRFGGSFPVGDVDALVRALETDFGVVAERREGTTFLRLRR